MGWFYHRQVHYKTPGQNKRSLFFLPQVLWESEGSHHDLYPKAINFLMRNVTGSIPVSFVGLVIYKFTPLSCHLVLPTGDALN